MTEYLRVDTTASAIITDAGAFPPETTAPSKEDLRQGIYPLRVYEGFNYLPTGYGYKSYFGQDAVLDASGLVSPDEKDLVIEDLFVYQTRSFANVLVALTSHGIYLRVSGDWVRAVVIEPPEAEGQSLEWTKTTINNLLFMYRQGNDRVFVFEDLVDGQGVLMDTFNGMKVTPERADGLSLADIQVFSYAPTFINMEGQVGIFRAAGSLGFWDTDQSIAWSAVTDVTDFEPSLTTLANITKLQDQVGSITAIKPHGDGFLVYCTRSILYAREESGALLRYTTDVVLGNVGVAFPKEIAVAEPDITHFAFTSAGLMEISSGQATPIVPDVSDYLKQTRTPQYLHMLNNRYLAIEVLDPNFLEGNVDFSVGSVDPENYSFPGSKVGGFFDPGATIKGREVCFAVPGDEEDDVLDSGVKPYHTLPIYRQWLYSGGTVERFQHPVGKHQILVHKVREGTTQAAYENIPVSLKAEEVPGVGQEQIDAMFERQVAAYEGRHSNIEMAPNELSYNRDLILATTDFRNGQLLLRKYIPEGFDSPEVFVRYTPDGYTLTPGYPDTAHIIQNAPGGDLLGHYFINSGAVYARVNYNSLMWGAMLGAYGELDLPAPLDLWWERPWDVWLPLGSLNSLESNGLAYIEEGTNSLIVNLAEQWPSHSSQLVFMDLEEPYEPTYALIPSDVENHQLLGVEGGKDAYKVIGGNATTWLYRIQEASTYFPLLRSMPVFWTETTRYQMYSIDVETGEPSVPDDTLTMLGVAYTTEGAGHTGLASKTITYEYDSFRVNTINLERGDLYGDLASAQTYYIEQQQLAYTAYAEALRAHLHQQATELYNEVIAAAIADAQAKGYTVTGAAVDQYSAPPWSPDYAGGSALRSGRRVMVPTVEATYATFGGFYVKPQNPIVYKAHPLPPELFGETQVRLPAEATGVAAINAMDEGAKAGLIAVNEHFYNNNNSKEEPDPSFLVTAAGRYPVPLGSPLGTVPEFFEQANFANRYFVLPYEGAPPRDAFGQPFSVPGVPDEATLMKAQQKVVCGITDDIVVPPLSRDPIVYEPWEIEVPELTWVLSNGSRAPYDPTFHGALVFDLHLQKWGVYRNTHKLLLDYQPINTYSPGGVSYENYMIDGGCLTLDKEIALFTDYPEESRLRYGKFQYPSSPVCGIEELQVDFRGKSTGMVAIQYSLDGRSLEYGHSVAKWYNEALSTILNCDIVGQWATVAFTGHFDISGIRFKSNSSGRR